PPWYFDRRTEWYDGPTCNTDPGYKDAYRNDMSQTRFGLDVTNTMVMTTDSAGLFTFDYGLSFSDEGVGPGDSAPIMHDDLV
ncbi:hypothetical protein, partial [Stenotrophomonas sp. GbtcB23]|uniref:hypothetical protein n=1 Tax=Stenotrophomonas sp. GbtcB23 TaxID=2824768 RepID=UPI001C30D3CB